MLGPIEIRCEAPPYGMVRACVDVGFQTPLDVPWRDLRTILTSEENDDGGGVGFWHRLFGKGKSASATCTCGEPLPELRNYSVTFQSNWIGDYKIVQCNRCLTIFWELSLPMMVVKDAIGKGSFEN